MSVRQKPIELPKKQKKKRLYIPKPEPDPVDQKYFTIAQLAKRYEVTKRAIEWWVQKGRFPKPRRFGHRTSRWLVSEVEKHEEAADSKAQTVRSVS
jgi:predicted DNA-binding transcriptional regulator AlpA